VPVFKKGVSGSVQNYRPISLTCVVSKIMERIVSDRITNHLLANNILHSAQHGFLKNRSTTTNLIECFNDWTVCAQDRCQMAVVYTSTLKKLLMWCLVRSCFIDCAIMEYAVMYFCG